MGFIRNPRQGDIRFQGYHYQWSLLSVHPYGTCTVNIRYQRYKESFGLHDEYAETLYVVDWCIAQVTHIRWQQGKVLQGDPVHFIVIAYYPRVVVLSSHLKSSIETP